MDGSELLQHKFSEPPDIIFWFHIHSEWMNLEEIEIQWYDENYEANRKQ